MNTGASRPRYQDFVVIVVGHLHGMPCRAELVASGVRIIHHDTLRQSALQAELRNSYPSWLVVASGLDETALAVLIAMARQVAPAILIALLGDDSDLDRCDLWLRRGINAYLSARSDIERVLAILAAASQNGVVAYDDAFRREAQLRRAQLLGLSRASTLTRRENEVLAWLKDGHRNSEIAAALHIDSGTVENHITRLLAKLAARNRTEAVAHATSAGLL